MFIEIKAQHSLKLKADMQVLRQSRGTLRLVDVSSHLPSFPRCPGLHSWSLKCKSAFFTEYAKAEEV